MNSSSYDTWTSMEFRSIHAMNRWPSARGLSAVVSRGILILAGEYYLYFPARDQLSTNKKAGFDAGV